MKAKKTYAIRVLLVAFCASLLTHSASASSKEFHSDIAYASQWRWLHANASNLPDSFISMRVWPKSPDAQRALNAMMRQKAAKKRAEASRGYIVAARAPRHSSLAQYHGW